MSSSDDRRPSAFDPARILFIASLCLLAMGYGIASMLYKWFPYELVTEAREAWHALRNMDEDSLFAGVLELDEEAAAAPVITRLDKQAGPEKLLVTGGPYHFLQRCPRYGCMAWVIDRTGKVLHSWEVNTEALFEDLPETAGRPLIRNIYPSGIALGKDGSLIMAFQARNTFPFQIGIAKVDRDGKLLWKRWDHNNHWLRLDAAGNIYAPSMHFEKGRKFFGNTAVDTRCNGRLDVAEISIYSPDGKRLRKFDLEERILASGYPGLLYGLRDGCDPIHLNSIDLATPAVAAAIPGVNEGDMLVSLRESSAVAILDKSDGHIKKLVAGRTAAQHGARFLPDGSVIVLGNQGFDRRDGGSRVVRLNMVTHDAKTIFPRPQDRKVLPFFTKIGGYIDVSPDGRRAMVAMKEEGRALEIDVATGAPLWSYVSNFDIAPYLERQGVKAKTSRARLQMWGVYYVSDQQFSSAGLGN